MMNLPTLWWILAAAAVGLELITGTFYLLMLALGLAAGALAAHAGAGLSLQLVLASLVGGGAVTVWHLRRAARHAPPDAGSNRDLNLDIGETVQVAHWNADGTASVRHRGAQWTAVHPAGVTPASGAHRVTGVTGSHLILEKI